MRSEWKLSKAYLEDVLDKKRHHCKEGQPANYIPELNKADPKITGISVCSKHTGLVHAGNTDHVFTIQSISKVLSLILVLSEVNLEAISRKVNLEPAREAFNSLLPLELGQDPTLFNPLSNPGAMVISSLISGSTNEKMERLLSLASKLSGKSQVDWDEKVYHSEKATGFRNKAAAYLLKERGTLEGNPEKILDLYFKQCSIKLNCQDLARMACVIALDGCDPESGSRIVHPEVARNVRTIMATYGMYNQSGIFAVKIGLPSKSGVSGGIMAVVPKEMGIGVYNPAVNDKGNSIVGFKMLEQLSGDLDLSIY